MYKVIDIIEPDFGCEGLPDGQEYCVDIILNNTETADNITVNVADAELYKKEIDIGSFVEYCDNILTKV